MAFLYIPIVVFVGYVLLMGYFISSSYKEHPLDLE